MKIWPHKYLVMLWWLCIVAGDAADDVVDEHSRDDHLVVWILQHLIEAADDRAPPLSKPRAF